MRRVLFKLLVFSLFSKSYKTFVNGCCLVYLLNFIGLPFTIAFVTFSVDSFKPMQF